MFRPFEILKSVADDFSKLFPFNIDNRIQIAQIHTSIFKLLALLSSVNVRPRPLSAELSPPRRVIFDVGIFFTDKFVLVLLLKLPEFVI
jgi:hypothetical protein